MNDIVKMCIAIIIFSIIFRVIKYRGNVQENGLNLDESALVVFKGIGYLLLASWIFMFFKRTGTQKIDILTLFTFMLSCFEATHNFISTLGNSIASFIALIVFPINK